jgi:hypothetical protein
MPKKSQINEYSEFWGCILKGCFERGIFRRAKSHLKVIESKTSIWNIDPKACGAYVVTVLDWISSF